MKKIAVSLGHHHFKSQKAFFLMMHTFGIADFILSSLVIESLNQKKYAASKVAAHACSWPETQ